MNDLNFNFPVNDENIKNKLSTFSNELKEIYYFINKTVLSRIPHNPNNDNAFYCLSNRDPKCPIYLYQKGPFIIEYKIDHEKTSVYILNIDVIKPV